MFDLVLNMPLWTYFTRFYLEKNKILSVHVKEKSCNSPEGLQLYEKETPTRVQGFT